MAVGDSVSRRSRVRLNEPVMAHWEQHNPSRFEDMIIRPYAQTTEFRTGTSHRDGSASSSQGVSVAGTRASSYRPSSTASDNVPSLNRSFGTMSTRTIDTDESLGSSRQGSSISGFGVARPQTGTLQCTFAFLGCHEEFISASSWKTHCNSHFYSHPPPTRSQCPFCASQWEHPSAWEDRLDHISSHHRGDRIDAEYRVDYSLFRHLFRLRVVNSSQYQELERRGRCDGVGGVYLETNNSRRERREGAPRGWTSYRVGG
jgi:hypothetical protein